MKYFGWIDFSRRDRDLARDIIASLNEHSAVDELGIGIIRDGFADYFFPGTSTIQTIAKYFFLVSYQVKELTQTPQTNPELALRKIEQECSKKMWESLSPEEQNKGSAGIFGRTFFKKDSKDWVKRAPSEIYWGGIRKLGFLKCSSPLSLSEFLRISQNQEPLPVESDEDLKNGKSKVAGFEKSWHWNLPPVEARDDWHRAPNVKLTSGEAEFLIERIKEEVPDSMFSFLIPFRGHLPEYFSDLVKLNLPDHLKNSWQRAYDFSEFIKPAQVRFNVLLGNEKAKDEWESNFKNKLPELAGLAASTNLLSAVFSLLKIEKHGQLCRFLEDLQEVYRNGDIELFDRILCNREKQLKGSNRMKLKQGNETPDPRYQEIWVGGFGLDYRYPDACRLLTDVVNAEEVQ